ncbi:MAG: aconitase X catalytic domain-containing protein [Butyricicoccus sp.]|nr:aconitase X catalytic domain-containing protein [Butyricicoccus sp.]
MKLTDYEKAMLQGEHGEIRQKALQTLCDLAAFFDVEEFVEIVGCHDDSTVYAGEAQVAFAEMLAEQGGRFAVPTTTNSMCCDLNRWADQKHDITSMSASRRIEASHMKMGAIPTWSCAPYHLGVAPSFGQQFAAAESNVICYYNSIIGARTNRYAGPLEMLCGITGRAPYYGLHKTENRYAQGLVRLGDDIRPEYFTDENTYNLVSYAFGSIVQDRIWALDGVPAQGATNEILKQFSATACSSGGIALFHMIGITPEAQTLEQAFNGHKPQEIVEIHLNDLAEAENQLSNPNEERVDAVLLGCPHCSYNEAVMIRDLLRGRRIHDSIDCWLMTARSTLDRLKYSGVYEDLVRCGVQIFCDGCPLEAREQNLGWKSMMSYSGKFGTYCFSMHGGIQPVFGSMKDCIETAVAGRVVKEAKPWRK